MKQAIQFLPWVDWKKIKIANQDLEDSRLVILATEAGKYIYEQTKNIID